MLDMNFPSSYESSEPIIADLLIRNISHVPAVLEISSLKTCTCVPLKTQISMSISKMILSCPHKNQAKFKPTFFEIEAS